jgi:tRNA G10  N-methylase Trm11
MVVPTATKLSQDEVTMVLCDPPYLHSATARRAAAGDPTSERSFSSVYNPSTISMQIWLFSYLRLIEESVTYTHYVKVIGTRSGRIEMNKY